LKNWIKTQKFSRFQTVYNLATMDPVIQEALKTDQTIDIITTGAKTGLPRRTEIWFWNIDGRIIICGTPSASGEKGSRAGRDWLANLRTNPEFLFCLKETVQIELPARAKIITDPADRRAIMSAPQTHWYREQMGSIEELVAASPVVEIFFLED
jgi:F420H(2)-dependent quinone reductase